MVVVVLFLLRLFLCFLFRVFSFFFFFFVFSLFFASFSSRPSSPPRRRLRPRTDPIPRPANVIGEESTAVIVALDSPTVLQCYAIGWPRPVVTWWRTDRMLPMSSDLFEQRSDHSLVIRLVTVNTLGPYTCQAYNGLGRAASWSVTLQAHGTTVGNQPDNPYLVPPPRHPTTGDVIRLRPIVVKLTRPPPVYRVATTTAIPPPSPWSQTDAEPVQPPQHKVFTGKHDPRPPYLSHKPAALPTLKRKIPDGLVILKIVNFFGREIIFISA